MDKTLTLAQKKELAQAFKIPLSRLLAFLQVESGGHGFDPKTGKIIIQFEPNWFRKYSKVWVPNGVEKQEKEWLAFNKAFYINKEAALLSTSIGLMQVMGFNYKRCGFKSVGAFWDACKVSEREQVKAGLNFIKSDPALYNAVIQGDWHTVASKYNGSGYKALAKRLGIVPYNEQLAVADAKYAKMYPV